MNGDYKGSYQLSESIKIDKNRINIDKKKGIVVEIDKHYEEDGIPGFFGDHQIPYAMKDPDERKKGKEDDEGITDDKIAGFKSRILAFEKVLYGKDFKDPKNGWTKYLDLDSAVDYYLVKEFSKENDGDFYRSNFFYMPDYTNAEQEVLHGTGVGLRPQRRLQAGRHRERHDHREPERAGGCAATARRTTAPTRPTGTSR